MRNQSGFTLVELMLVLGVVPLLVWVAFDGMKTSNQSYLINQSYEEFESKMNLISTELNQYKKCTENLRDKALSLNPAAPQNINLDFSSVGEIKEGFSRDKKLYFSKVALVKTNENAGASLRMELQVQASPVVNGQPIQGRAFSKNFDLVVMEKNVSGQIQVDQCATYISREGQCLAYTRFSECNQWGDDNYGALEMSAIAAFACTQLAPEMVCFYDFSNGDILN